MMTMLMTVCGSLQSSQRSNTVKLPQVRGTNPTQAEQQARDESLRQELANVRKVNETIEDVIDNLNKARTNMKVGLAW